MPAKLPPAAPVGEGAAQLKTPLPSVTNAWPEVPSAEGKRHTTVALESAGPLKPE